MFRHVKAMNDAGTALSDTVRLLLISQSKIISK